MAGWQEKSYLKEHCIALSGCRHTGWLNCGLVRYLVVPLFTHMRNLHIVFLRENKNGGGTGV